jgi:hypothetical protein
LTKAKEINRRAQLIWKPALLPVLKLAEVNKPEPANSFFCACAAERKHRTGAARHGIS